MKNALKDDACYLFDNASQKVIRKDAETFTTFRVAVSAIKKPSVK